MTIRRIEADAEILSTRDVMLQLRPHITSDTYLHIVRRMMTEQQYRMAAAFDDAGVVHSVAGYRVLETLYCERLLSIEDLVTNERSRSAGYGRELLRWLKVEARAHGCREIHLDSRVHREAAHRFYFRERFAVRAFHFVAEV